MDAPFCNEIVSGKKRNEKRVNEMIEQLHQAAQYLAAAGISFLTPQPDDSHTNMAWDNANKRLLSRGFGKENFQLGLNYTDFNLEWMAGGVVLKTIQLAGEPHKKIVKWIKKNATESGIELPYEYAYHYQLPYPPLTKESFLALPSSDELLQEAEKLSVAKSAFEKLLIHYGLNSEIRVWPHHFDLGIYAALNANQNLFMGAGLAVPDELEQESYYYATGWLNGKSVETSGFSGLSEGSWCKEWSGATYLAKGRTVEEVFTFFSESLSAFQKVK